MNDIHQASLKQALKSRELPHLPGGLLHLCNFPHYLSVSNVDRDMVYWHPTLSHLINDRQIRTTLGKVLKAKTNLKDHVIRDIVEKHKDAMNRRHPVFELCWANEEDEWVSVYENKAEDDRENAFGNEVDCDTPLEDTCAEGSNSDSCMGHAESSYENGFHPVRIYGRTADLALAYIFDRKGVLARSICDLNRKAHVRVYQRYGTEGGSILRGLLANAGYFESRHLEARVRVEEYREYQLHMPYLDWDTRYDWESGERYARLHKHGQYRADNTTGIADEVDNNRTDCDCCGERFDSDDLTWVGDEAICESCLENNYTYAYTGRHQNYVSNDADVHYCEDNGESYTDRGIEYHDMVWDADGDLRDPSCVTWIDSLDRHYDNENCFEDVDGDYRHESEIDLDWFLDTSTGTLSEHLCEGEEWVQLGTFVFSELWSVKRENWTEIVMRNVVTYQIARRIVELLKTRIWRDVQNWEDRAAQYGVTFDEHDHAIIHGQLELRLAA